MQKSTEKNGFGTKFNSNAIEKWQHSACTEKKGVQTARDMQFSSFVAEIYSNN